MGIKYWRGNMVKPKYEQIQGVLKRGYWQYDVNEVQEVKLDNGVTLNICERQKLIDEKNKLIKGRKQAMEYLNAAEAE